MVQRLWVPLREGRSNIHLAIRPHLDGEDRWPARRVGGGRGEPPCRHASGGRLKSTPCNRPLRPDQVQPHVNNRLFRPGCVPFFFLSACPGGVSVHGKQCLSPYGFQDAGVDGRRRRHPALGVPATLLRGLPPPPGPWPPERRPKAGSKPRSPCPTIRGRQPDETCRPKSFLTPRLFQASCPRGTRARLRDPAHGWVS